MRAGGLRQRVTIQNFTTSRNSYGEVIEEWHDVVTVWAEVKGISGRELIAAGAEMSEVTFRVWIRYRPDVTSASRAWWQQKGHKPTTYAITSAIPNEKATHLELLCKGGLRV